MTEPEKMLWQSIQKNRVQGFRFKPQHPIDIFIADFYCHKLKLVIEIDREIHNDEDQREYDILRSDEMNQYGIKVIRYTNKQIIRNLNSVVEEIVRICVERKNELESHTPNLEI